MGGHAFGFEADRFTNFEYLAMQESLQRDFHGKLIPIPQIISKSSHGDLDLITTVSNIPTIAGELDRKKNGCVTSVLVSLGTKWVQVDFIYKHPDEASFARNYFSYGDAGMLLGGVAAYHRLSLGDSGLYYRFRGNRKILLTQNWDLALRVLGYTPERFHKGFYSAEAVHEFVMSSPYFSPTTFPLVELKHKRRVRYRKRPSYLKFVETVQYTPQVKPKRIKILPLFPEVLAKAKALREKERYSKALRRKFNGDIVMKVYPDLQGKALGKYMANFREKFDIKNMSAEEVLQSCEKFPP